MKTIEIKSTLRKSTGKKESKELRKQEMVPCVIYGGEENLHIAAHENEVRKIIYTPNVYLIQLDIEGTNKQVILKDIQFHPVSDKVLHIDFLQVSDDKPAIVNIPVTTEGNAVGVKEGGKLKIESRYLKVKGLINNIPEKIVVKIDHVALGESVKVRDLSIDNLEFLDAGSSQVISVKATRASKNMDLDAEGEGEEGSEEGGEEGGEESSEE